MGIGDARNTARALHVHIKSGGADPSKEKARLRAIGRDAKAGVGTLEALLDLYEMKGKPGAKLKSWKAQRQAIENVFAKHLARPLAMIKASDLQMSADAHRAEYAAALGVRCLRPVLRWGSVPARGFAPAGLVDIHPPATVQRRERVLTADELRSLLPTLATSPLPYAAAMRFMLWTLARREEVSSARWHDVDFETGVWTIPAAAAKNGKEHRVPLPRQAIAMLRDLEPGEPHTLIFATSTGASLSNWDRNTKALQVASSTSGWNRHDLRRTGATMLGKKPLDIPPHVIEAALNHVSIHSRLAALYNSLDTKDQLARPCKSWRIIWTISKPAGLSSVQFVAFDDPAHGRISPYSR